MSDGHFSMDSMANQDDAKRISDGTNDIFKICGFKKAEGSGVTKNSGHPEYLPIKFKQSELIERKGSISRVEFTLPFHHEKTITDNVSTKFNNTWGSLLSGTLGINAANMAQSLVTGGFNKAKDYIESKDLGDTIKNITESTLSFATNKMMFEYDAGSTFKTIQVPFIVPLGAAEYKKLENGACKEVRKVFNTLEGTIYPSANVNYYPPLLEMTIGGMYRSFFGFITGVNISPTNNDMFMDPCTGEYFNLVYEGTITFSNLFMYFHESSDPHFSIDQTGREVLFGDAALHDNPQYGYNINGKGQQYLGRSDVSILFSGYNSSTSYTDSNSQNSNRKTTDESYRIKISNDFNYAESSTWQRDYTYTVYGPKVFSSNIDFSTKLGEIRDKIFHYNGEDELDIETHTSKLNSLLAYLEQQYINYKREENFNDALTALKKFFENPKSIYDYDQKVRASYAYQETVIGA